MSCGKDGGQSARIASGRTLRCGLFIAFALCAGTPAHGLDNGVGLLPTMGWGTWNLFGCFGYNWTEVDVRQMADAMVSSGMRDAGYKFINLDGGWQHRRGVDGAPIPDAARFPSGIGALADYVHNLNLSFGLYRDRTADFGYEEADAKQYAAWGADYVKNDGYGPCRPPCKPHNLTSSEIYARFRDAVNATGRPMVLNIKFDVEPGGFEQAASLANSWRVGRDVRPVWADVVRLADIVAPLGHLAHPGGFNDLDALEVGVPAAIFKGGQGCSGFCPSSRVLRGECVDSGRNATMTLGEQKTMFSIWAITASMLIAGNDLRTMTEETRQVLISPGPISVNQDPLAVGGRRIRLAPAGLHEVWAKPLSTGEFAVLIWHRNESCLAHDDSAVHIDPGAQIFWSSLGFAGNAMVTDLWTMESEGIHADHWPEPYPAGHVGHAIAPHESVFIRVTPARDAKWAAMEHAHQCPAWGCEVQRKVHASWVRALAN